MRAQLNNIAIIPASMLTSQKTLNEKVKKFPRRQVFQRILEHVKEVFQRLGYAVTLLPMEQVA
jgi:hypothetical protein